MTGALSSWWVVCWQACSVVESGTWSVWFYFNVDLNCGPKEGAVLYQNVVLAFPLSWEVFQSLTVLFRTLAQQPLLTRDLGIVVCSLTIKKKLLLELIQAVSVLKFQLTQVFTLIKESKKVLLCRFYFWWECVLRDDTSAVHHFLLKLTQGKVFCAWCTPEHGWPFCCHGCCWLKFNLPSNT